MLYNTKRMFMDRDSVRNIKQNKLFALIFQCGEVKRAGFLALVSLYFFPLVSDKITTFAHDSNVCLVASK